MRRIIVSLPLPLSHIIVNAFYSTSFYLSGSNRRATVPIDKKFWSRRVMFIAVDAVPHATTSTQAHVDKFLIRMLSNYALVFVKTSV